MNDALPKDKFMLLSVVNTGLRDRYASLDELCEDLGADRDGIIAALESIGYSYNAAINRFC